MTADCKVVFCIMIACVTVFSTPEVIVDNNNGVCKRNVSYMEAQKIYYNTTYQENQTFLVFFTWTTTKTHTVYNLTYVKRWKIADTCCENYKDNNGTCEPQCSPPCMNGYCAQPDACACNPGYDGKFCDVPLLCVVDINSTAAMSKPLDLQTVRNISENPYIEPMRPTCHSKCQTQFNSTTAVEKIQHADGRIHYLIPIASPCNSSAADSSYITLIGTSMGFILFAVIFYTLYIVKRKQKTKEKTANKLTDQPKSYVCADYLEENPIYS